MAPENIPPSRPAAPIRLPVFSWTTFRYCSMESTFSDVPRVSRICPVTNWAKVSAMIRTASGPNLATSRDAVASR
ncbi:Uncharacterised protein [Mycobacterium tuberculosis]|uniref:Uncharacterized protein n=1 Tax=Mycobacterium tuberculosis TaxID=1773 RepID=A0A655APL3_MYCTX|nr:Uncharacterised protein [Mycobacterium tuberculosis]CKT69616.1 Uncharacterised protein [Mycobacterium tuberculosis]